MGVIDYIKDKITGQEEPPSPTFPRTFQSVRWNHAARSSGVGTFRNKIIAVLEQGEVVQKLPYNKHIQNAFEEEMSQPTLDETGGKQVPEHDTLANYLPNIIAYNQDNLEQISR